MTWTHCSQHHANQHVQAVVELHRICGTRDALLCVQRAIHRGEIARDATDQAAMAVVGGTFSDQQNANREDRRILPATAAAIFAAAHARELHRTQPSQCWDRAW